MPCLNTLNGRGLSSSLNDPSICEQVGWPMINGQCTTCIYLPYPANSGQSILNVTHGNINSMFETNSGDLDQLGDDYYGLQNDYNITKIKVSDSIK